MGVQSICGIAVEAGGHMSRSAILHVSWPIIGLSALLMTACLASIGYIGRLQSDLGESLRADAAMLQAAQQVQIHLREFRVHNIVLTASPSDLRRVQLNEDSRRIQASLENLRRLADETDDWFDLEQIETGWTKLELSIRSKERQRPGALQDAGANPGGTTRSPGVLMRPCC